jgi:hypothetical protein
MSEFTVTVEDGEVVVRGTFEVDYNGSGLDITIENNNTGLSNNKIAQEIEDMVLEGEEIEGLSDATITVS